MWGQDLLILLLSSLTRIIPTRVGTSVVVFEVLPLLQDHPHACGDKGASTSGKSLALGSSPRVWGQAVSDLWAAIIGRDHPHACGDKLLRSVIAEVLPGSSPRVWGQDLSCACKAMNYRIIPTRVGTRFFALKIFGSMRDHPHACGDKKAACN